MPNRKDCKELNNTCQIEVVLRHAHLHERGRRKEAQKPKDEVPLIYEDACI